MLLISLKRFLLFKTIDRYHIGLYTVVALLLTIFEERKTIKWINRGVIDRNNEPSSFTHTHTHTYTRSLANSHILLPIVIDPTPTKTISVPLG